MIWSELHCEGFDDRAFLAGWLETRGWTNLRPTGRSPLPIRNPITQNLVTKGRFAFQLKDVMFLEIIPGGGKEDTVRNACRTLKSSLTDAAPPAQVVAGRHPRGFIAEELLLVSYGRLVR